MIGVAAVVIVLDQAVKAVIVSDLTIGEHVEVLPVLSIVSVRNRGIAFGLLDNGSEGLVIAVTVVALAILVFFFARSAAGVWGWFGVGLVVGGALGNLIDRVRDGSVVDFIKFDLWPAFNLADSAITVGIAVLLLGYLERERTQSAADEAQPPQAGDPRVLPESSPPEVQSPFGSSR